MEESRMEGPADTIAVYIEAGAKRTFANALEWPGWSRSGRDEGAALQTLWAYGPRYARALGAAGIAFRAPTDASALVVVERLAGDTTTDFGAPDAVPSGDGRAVDEAELRYFQALLGACWQTFDAMVEAAGGKELRKGPRGGGRELQEIVEHVHGAEAAYLGRLGWKMEAQDEGRGDGEPARTRRAVLEALAAAVHGELGVRGPRGGVRWTPRFFVRRVAWHALDHAWEIADRST